MTATAAAAAASVEAPAPDEAVVYAAMLESRTLNEVEVGLLPRVMEPAVHAPAVAPVMPPILVPVQGPLGGKKATVTLDDVMVGFAPTGNGPNPVRHRPSKAGAISIAAAGVAQLGAAKAMIC